MVYENFVSKEKKIADNKETGAVKNTLVSGITTSQRK